MAIQNTSRPTMFQSISRMITLNTKPMFMIFALAAAMALLFFAHKLWVVKRESAAQYDFSVLMTEYEAMSLEKNPEWSSLLEKFEKNYEKHSNSSLLPYYLGYKVQILLAQDKQEEALAALNGMISNMPSSTPMLALYEMERALIQLDSADEQLNVAGLEMLKALSNNSDNMFRDSAQYYLGRYYWAQNDIDAARQVWQQLVEEQRDEKVAPSPWVGHVQEQLALTIT